MDDNPNTENQKSSSKSAATRVYLKLESEQVTGTFKARGALNKLLIMKDSAPGFVTASTGSSKNPMT